MAPTLASLRDLAAERSIAHPVNATRSELIALLRPPSTDTTLDAHILRDLLGILPTSPDKRSPLVPQPRPRAPPPCKRASIHSKKRAASDVDDNDGKATQVRRLIEVTWQLA